MAKNEFVKKRIKTMTLGEKLKKARAEKRLTLADLSRATKIQIKYLEYLEEGFYDKLPPDVYIKGFLRGVAAQVGLSEDSLIRCYEREREIGKNTGQIDIKEKFMRPVVMSRFFVTPKTFIFLLIALLVFFGFYYIYREAVNFVHANKLVVFEPADNAETENSEVTVKGVSNSDSKIYINEKAVLVDAEGNFGEKVSLKSGTNSIIVRSVNRFNKETQRIISVKLSEREEEQEISDEGDENIIHEKTLRSVILRAGENPVWVSCETDGVVIYSGELKANERKEFQIKESITVSAKDGSAVYLKIGEKDEFKLSEKREAVDGLVFQVE